MATLAEALASRGVDLRAIGGGSIGDSGHVIMTTADDDTTKAVLDEKGYNYIEANRSSPRSMTDRAGWRVSRVRWLTPTSTSTATCSSGAGATEPRSRSWSTIPNGPPILERKDYRAPTSPM